jgi:hypothetical protein
VPTQALLMRHQYALTPYFAASPRVLSPFSAQTHDTFVDVSDGRYATEDTPSLSNSDPISCCRYLAVLFAPCCRSILPTCGLGILPGILCLLVPQIRPPPQHTLLVATHRHNILPLTLSAPFSAFFSLPFPPQVRAANVSADCALGIQFIRGNSATAGHQQR